MSKSTGFGCAISLVVAFAACGGSSNGADANNAVIDATTAGADASTTPDAAIAHVDAAISHIDAAISHIDAADLTADATVVLDANAVDANLGPDAAPGQLSASWTPEFSHLVGYWTFDGVNASTVHNEAAIPAVVGVSGDVIGDELMNYVPGVAGSGLEFDSNHVIRVTSSGTVAGSFTVQAWVKYNSDQDYNGSIFGTREGTSATNGDSIDFKVNDSTYVHADVGEADTTQDAFGDFSIGVWHQIVYAISPTEFTIYRDGAPIGDGPMNAAMTLYTDGTVFEVGSCGPSCDGSPLTHAAEPFGGEIDEFAIWNSTLSDSDVAMLYAGGSQGNAIDASWTPQFANIVNYLNLDGTIGQAADDSTITATVGPNGTLFDNNATNNNGPDTGLSYAQGQIAQAISCPDTDFRIALPQTQALTGEYTLSFWTNPTADSLNNGGDLFYVEDSRGNTTLQIVYNSDGTFGIDNPDADNNNDLINISSNTALTTDQWHYVVYTVSAGAYALYIDGNLDNSGTWTQPYGTPLLSDSTHPMFFANGDGSGGNGQGANNSFPGAIDESAIWNTALSAADVATLYENGIAGTAIDSAWTPHFANIVEYLNFDDALNSNTPITAAIGSAGTLFPAGTLSTTPGVVGNAIQFDGKSYVEISNSPSVSGTYSVQLWMQYPNDQNIRGTLFGTQSVVGGNASFDIEQNNNGFQVNIGDGNNWIENSSENGDVNVLIGSWQQLVYVVTPTSAAIYVNGKLEATQSFNTPSLFTTEAPLSVCNSPDFGAPAGGLLDDVAVWDKALSATEVDTIYTMQGGV